MQRVRLIVVSGFLGAGKTTAVIRLARSLEAAGKRCAIVLNDQGEDLVDSALGRATRLQVAEVTGGCFCCRFDDLTTTTIELVQRTGVDIILAEAVGSCTDLSATVIRPLRKYFGNQFTVAPLVVFVEPPRLRELRQPNSEIGVLRPYLFEKQLADADLIVLSKVDLLQPEERARLESVLRSAYPDKELLSISARTGAGMEVLRQRLLLDQQHTSPYEGLDIDYSTYARAEAELAWLNASATVSSGKHSAITSRQWLNAFISELSEQCERHAVWIGHVKAHLQSGHGVSKASVTRAGDVVGFDLEDPETFTCATLLVNARVCARPEELEATVRAAFARVDERLGTSTPVTTLRAFSPPPPKPTHRLVQARIQDM